MLGLEQLPQLLFTLFDEGDTERAEQVKDELWSYCKELENEVNVEVGDWAELWGASVPVEDIGDRCNTIAYTLVCGIGRRVDRVYTGQTAQ